MLQIKVVNVVLGEIHNVQHAISYIVAVLTVQYLYILRTVITSIAIVNSA